MIKYQILLTKIIRIAWQKVRRISYEMLRGKGTTSMLPLIRWQWWDCTKRSVFLPKAEHVTDLKPVTLLGHLN